MVKAPSPKVLFLAHRVPYPPHKGDRIRSFHVLKYLAHRAEVHLACLADEPVGDEVVGALRRYCERVAIIPLGRWSRWGRALWSLARGRTVTEGAFSAPALWATLRQWAGQTRFQVCLVSASSMVPYLRLAELQQVPKVIDLVDVDSQKWIDLSAAGHGPRAWLYGTEGRRLRRLEQALPTWARAVILVGEAEADLYRRFCAAGPVWVVTNGVDLDYFRPRAPSPLRLSPTQGERARGEREEECVFVGALDYYPNVDGAAWFCREVWPEIIRQRPQAQLRLVGRRPAPAVRRLAKLTGVDLVGQVPDVRPHLTETAVTVVPLRFARGVQNKVLESLAMGKATVATPQACQGLKVEPGVHVVVASSPDEWVAALLRFWDDPCLRQRFGSSARRYVEEHHRWDRCLEPLGALLGLPSNGQGSVVSKDKDSSSRTTKHCEIKEAN